MFRRGSAVIAFAAAALVGGFASAATIDPSDFDVILTEDQRVTTIDGADVSGHAALADNGDVKVLVMDSLAAGESRLLVGNVTPGGADQFFIERQFGTFEGTVLNFAADARNGGGAFRMLFKLFVGGELVETLDLSGEGDELIEDASFSSRVLAGESLLFMAHALDGFVDFDVALRIADEEVLGFGKLASVTAAPVPAGLPLMLSIAAIGWTLRRRRQKA